MFDLNSAREEFDRRRRHCRSWPSRSALAHVENAAHDLPRARGLQGGLLEGRGIRNYWSGVHRALLLFPRRRRWLRCVACGIAVSRRARNAAALMNIDRTWSIKTLRPARRCCSSRCCSSTTKPWKRFAVRPVDDFQRDEDLRTI